MKMSSLKSGIAEKVDGFEDGQLGMGRELCHGRRIIRKYEEQ